MLEDMADALRQQLAHADGCNSDLAEELVQFVGAAKLFLGSQLGIVEDAVRSMRNTDNIDQTHSAAIEAT